jgi:transmembrane sensor
MAKVVHFSSRARTREEAAAWLARVDRGLTAEERTALRAWLHAQQLNYRVFLEMASLWDEMDVLSELSDVFPLDRSPRQQRRSALGTWSLAAAAGVLLAALGWFGAEHLRAPAPGVETARNVSERFRTAVGEYMAEQLPDGTVVTLNTDTSVDVVYSEARRDVFLRKGEAHFEVAHAPEWPFYVHVGGSVVQAVGTAFNVRLGAEGGIEVTVIEGKVQIGRAEEPGSPNDAQNVAVPLTQPSTWDATVVGGQVAVLDGAAAAKSAPQIAQIEPVDIDIKLAWQRGMLVFRGESLGMILSEVGRYTTTQFVLADQDLAAIRVGGYFRAGDVDGLLLFLRENFQIESEPADNDRVILRAARR